MVRHLFPAAVLTACAVILTGCVPAERYRSLQKANADLAARNAELEASIDELRNGGPRRLAEARQAFSAKDFDRLRAATKELKERHPGSTEAAQAGELVRKAIQIEAEAKAAEEARKANAERERKRKEREEREAREALLARATAHLSKKHDDVRDLTWFEHDRQPEFVNTRCYVLPYFAKGDHGGVENLRIKFNYTGDDWVFWETVICKVDSQSHEFSVQSWDINRDNGSGGVWETLDRPLNGRWLTCAEAMAKADRVIIRFQGDHHRHDFEMPAADRRAIGEVLAAYESMGGSFLRIDL